MTDIHGINLAMQTPFDDSGGVDFAGLDRLLDQYLVTGLHGFVLSAGTGQHPYLTEDECNKIFAAALKRIDGKVPVICQTSALNLEEVVRRSKAAEDLGADAIMVLPPFFEGPSHDDGIFAFYELIDNAVSIDIIGYNIPQSTGVELSPELFRRLGELEHFNYIKDSSGDFAKQQVLLATGGQNPERQRYHRALLDDGGLRRHHLGRRQFLSAGSGAALRSDTGQKIRRRDSAVVAHVPIGGLLLVQRLYPGGQGRLPPDGLRRRHGPRPGLRNSGQKRKPSSPPPWPRSRGTRIYLEGLRFKTLSISAAHSR